MLRFIFLIFILPTILAQSLPYYIGKCSYNDRRVSECIARQGNKAIRKLVKGDIYYDIPYMSPLYMPLPITLRYDKELKFTLKDAVIYGLENTLISTMNFTGFYAEAVLINPNIQVLANYEINGKLLNTPIFGKGAANFTLDRGVYRYAVDVAREQRDGELYFKLVRPRAAYETVQSFYQLDNLYNGDKYLGTQMNELLNRNWLHVQKALRPAANIVISNLITTVINGVANNVPANEIFKP